MESEKISSTAKLAAAVVVSVSFVLVAGIAAVVSGTNSTKMAEIEAKTVQSKAETAAKIMAIEAEADAARSKDCAVRVAALKREMGNFENFFYDADSNACRVMYKNEDKKTQWSNIEDLSSL